MSLITRCPACTTMFRVVPDQLRVSGGWVRCGHCQEVFDASANLQPPVVAQSPVPEVAPTPDVAPEVEVAPVAEVASAPEDMPAPVSSDTREPFLDVNPGALELKHHALAEPTLEPEREVYPDASSSGEPQLQEPTVSPERGEPLDVVQADEPPPPAPVAVPDGDVVMVPSFVTRNAPKPRAMGTRILWGVAGFILAVGLGVQVVVHERNRLVAYEPATLPFLKPLCDILGCSFAPVRQIESVVIDSSAFTRVRGDVYRLTVTYRNMAPIAVETPALELTLTDLQDQAVVRRVFLSKELGLGQTQLDAASDAAIALPLTLKNTMGGDRIAGYRLLAFYP